MTKRSVRTSSAWRNLAVLIPSLGDDCRYCVMIGFVIFDKSDFAAPICY
jgi:hypothetical protein